MSINVKSNSAKVSQLIFWYYLIMEEWIFIERKGECICSQSFQMTDERNY